MTVVVDHSPARGTSRNALEFIRRPGTGPAIFEFLEAG